MKPIRNIAPCWPGHWKNLETIWGLEMRTPWILALALLLACSACSVKVTPLQTETGTINPEDQSITEVRNGVAFTVKLDALKLMFQHKLTSIRYSTSEKIN